jgi:hypothetical protein
VETLAELLLALLFVGFVKAYIDGGWAGGKSFVRAKVIGT